MRLFALTLVLTWGSVSWAQEFSSARNALSAFLGKDNDLSQLAFDAWALDIQQAHDALQFIRERWPNCRTDAERQLLVEKYMTERCHLFRIDPSSNGLLRQYMMGGKPGEQVLAKLHAFNLAQVRKHLRDPRASLSKERKAIYTRLTEQFHLGQHKDVLLADIRDAYLSVIPTPAYEQLKDIPKWMKELLPEASDRKLLTQTEIIQIFIKQKNYLYVLINDRVAKIVIE